MAEWVGKSATLMRPLLDALARHVMSAERLLADDSPVPVLAPGAERTKTGRLWSYVRDDRPFAGTAPPAMLDRYTPDRRGEHPRAHLAGFGGILQADGYTGSAELYERGDVSEAACWAHARCKLHDVLDATKSPLACEALERIGVLHYIEHDIQFADPDAGGERASAIYSLVDTAKLNGLDPKASLRNVLTRVADYSVARVAELLPWMIDTPAA